MKINVKCATMELIHLITQYEVNNYPEHKPKTPRMFGTYLCIT